jgi:carbon monoxide dehydrogenase subunit G
VVETHGDGRLKEATTIALVRAPIESTWAALMDFPSYGQWMPQVRKAEVSDRAGNEFTVDWLIAVVGPDIALKTRVQVDEANHRIKAWQTGGALPGSRWEWRLHAVEGGTRVERVVKTTAVDSNWLIRQVEDDFHTLDYGINAAEGVVEIKGLKRRLGVP